MKISSAMEIIKGLFIAAIGTTIGGIIVATYFAMPSPVAYAQCNPSIGNAPLAVICKDRSQHAKQVHWKFDNKDLESIACDKKDENKECAKYIFQEAGEYQITLTAHGNGSNKWSSSVDVLDADLLFQCSGYRIYKIRVCTENNHSFDQQNTKHT